MRAAVALRKTRPTAGRRYTRAIASSRRRAGRNWFLPQCACLRSSDSELVLRRRQEHLAELEYEPHSAGACVGTSATAISDDTIKLRFEWTFSAADLLVSGKS